MNRLVTYIPILLAIFLMSSCGAKKGTKISGNISDAQNMTIFFDRVEIQSSLPISKMDSDGKGNFSFEFPEGLEAGIYRVRAGAKTAHLIIKGDEKDIEINGNVNDMGVDNYEVIGSQETIDYTVTMQKFRNKEMSLPELSNYAKGVDPLLGVLLALRSGGFNTSNLDLHNSLSAKLKANYPVLEFTTEYGKIINQLNIQHQRQLALAKVKVGEPAPDIALEDPDGNVRKLSDLKGNVVLLDFWASWCGPCRRENPKVVQTYHKYKDKGFTVYSVSLDGIDAKTAARYNNEDQVKKTLKNSKNRWLAAIEKDKLEWDDHVSDLKKWDSAAAADYGVKSIPQTFLIGRDGKIAALNPRRNLEEALLQIL